MSMSFNEFKKWFSGGAYTFKGGIHPDDMKESTCGKAIIDFPPSDEMVFPVQMHLGAPAVPCVQVGDRVLMGQKIAEAGGYVSANIHSSVSGTVKAIEPRKHHTGVKVNSIVIENDGLDELHPDIKGKNWREMSNAEIVEVIRDAGMVGMGGATFPTHVKLSPPPEKKIEYAIVNGAECEPYLTSDHRVMLETPDEVIEGLKIIMKLFDLKEGYIAIETNKPDAIKKMAELAKLETEVKINVVKVKTKYPQGSEKQLINAITGRYVPPGKLPMDVGVVVDNIDTCAAIARAFIYGKPVCRRIVTVSGDCIKKSANFRVRVGTNVEDILSACGEFDFTAAKVIIGGPLMGVATPWTDVPVAKGTSGILVFSEKLAKVENRQSCLRCGKCVEACPMHLLPNRLKEAVELNDMESLKKLNITDCMQCGSCAYICPAEQNPVQHIRTGKAKLIKAEKGATK